MKTTSDINALINENIAAINRLKHDYDTGEFFTRESQARAYKQLRKKSVSTTTKYAIFDACLFLSKARRNKASA